MMRTRALTLQTLAVLSLLAPVAQAKPKDTGMTFEPETVERQEPKKPQRRVPAGERLDSAAASKTLDKAIKLYENSDYANATIQLNKVIEGESRDDDANRQRAEFFMGKALFNMKYYSASLSYFDRIVQKGNSHRFYNKTLQWLASLSRFLPDSAGVLEKVGKYTRQDLETPALEPVRDQLYYLLGRYHYTKGNFPEAVGLFQMVPEKSEYFPPSKFLEGITYVRENKGQPAAEAFKAILRRTKTYCLKPGDDPKKVCERKKAPRYLREYEDLANLSLGRVFYATKQLDLSIKYFEKLDQSSPDWLPSIFEASWAYFMKDGDSKALGNIHSVNSPFFENEFYPEAYVLKAVIYFNRCNFDRSQEAIDEYNNLYPPLKKEVDELVTKYPDNAQFYDYIIKIVKGDSTGLSQRVARAAEGALSDRSLAKHLEYVAELDRELKAFEKSDPSWRSTGVAANIQQDLTLQKSLAANEAGNLARQRLQRLSREINEMTKQAIKVEYETLNAMKGQMTAGLLAEASVINPNARNYNVIQIDDEHQQWPFRGEWWKDELGYYRFKVANKCGGQGTKK